MTQLKRTFGLALGGGGARGFVHVGVLKVLEEEGIHIDMISGTSMGGIIAAAYGVGLSADYLREKVSLFSHGTELFKLLDLRSSRRGLIAGTSLREYLADILGEETTFEDLKMPTFLCTADIVRAKEVIFSSGELLPAVMATCAVPGIFPPVENGEYRLVDGGILNNVPVNVLREHKADVILAVDCQDISSMETPWQDMPDKPLWMSALPDWVWDLYRSNLVMVSEISRLKLEETKPDILLVPKINPGITMMMGFMKANEAIQTGEDATREIIPELKRRLYDD